MLNFILFAGFVSYCCKGFCVDLLKHLANKINVTYDLALSPDGQFGSYMIKNSSSEFSLQIISIITIQLEYFNHNYKI